MGWWCSGGGVQRWILVKQEVSGEQVGVGHECGWSREEWKEGQAAVEGPLKYDLASP